MKEVTRLTVPKVQTEHVRRARSIAAVEGLAITDLVRAFVYRVTHDEKFTREFVKYSLSQEMES